VKPLVSVRWRDAHGTSTTAYAEHEIPHAAIEITTIGFLLRRDEAGVSIAGEYCADNTYRGVTFIPSGMTIEVVELGKPKRARKPVVTKERA